MPPGLITSLTYCLHGYISGRSLDMLVGRQVGTDSPWISSASSEPPQVQVLHMDMYGCCYSV